MPLRLTPVEARILGCLMEKSVTTPDQYPLTLNSLTAACNQKSSRHPVMSLSKGETQRTLRELADKRVVVVDQNFKTQVEKYTHRFCNTPFSDYTFDSAQYAIVCTLLLRGSRTPGELRANCSRLHNFLDNSQVIESLESLMSGDNPCVVMLPRVPGRRDNEYTHLFYGEIKGSEQTVTTPQKPTPQTATTNADLEQRVSQLEIAVEELRKLIK